MKPHAALDAIPTGLTCEGVHRAVVEHLLRDGGEMSAQRVLDIPCGRGDLIGTLRAFFPGIDARGCDLERPPALDHGDFAAVDASQPFDVFPGTTFDTVLSVSGVMEFDNTLQFFQSCHRHLREGGQFIVTNDNVVTMWDRLSYLFFGKTRQFQLFVNQGQGTWKVLPIHNLFRILRDAGFTIRKLDYLSIERRNWLLLPLALLIYPLQMAYIQITRNPMSLAEKRWMYPFRSLLCRHYIVVCEKAPPSASPQSAAQ